MDFTTTKRSMCLNTIKRIKAQSEVRSMFDARRSWFPEVDCPGIGNEEGEEEESQEEEEESEEEESDEDDLDEELSRGAFQF